MAVKYFCDICNKEVELGERIILMGSANPKISTLCQKCWNIAELKLLRIAKKPLSEKLKISNFASK